MGIEQSPEVLLVQRRVRLGILVIRTFQTPGRFAGRVVLQNVPRMCAAEYESQ